MLGIISFLLLINITNLWFRVEVKVNNVTLPNSTFEISTSKSCTSFSTLVFARDLLNANLRSLMPFTLMIIGNVVLIKALIKSKKNSNRQANPNNRSSISKSAPLFGREQQFAASILAMNIFFMIFYLPQASTILLLGIFAYKPELAPATAEAAITLAFNIAVYIGLINNSVAFFINLKFNKIFREELLQLIVDIKVKLRLADAEDCGAKSSLHSNNNHTHSKNHPVRALNSKTEKVPSNILS